MLVKVRNYLKFFLETLIDSRKKEAARYVASLKDINVG